MTLMQIIIGTLTGANWPLEVESSSSIYDIKRMITEQRDIPFDQQRLVCCGLVLGEFMKWGTEDQKRSKEEQHKSLALMIERLEKMNGNNAPGGNSMDTSGHLRPVLSRIVYFVLFHS